MAIRIDPTATTTIEIDGETFTLKTLTARQRMAFIGKVNRACTLFESDGMDALEEVAEIQYAALVLGLEEDPDTVDPQRWDAILKAIMEANKLTEADSGN